MVSAIKCKCGNLSVVITFSFKANYSNNSFGFRILWMSLLNISQQICKSQFDLIHVTHTHDDMRLSTSRGLYVARGVAQLIFNSPSSVLSSAESSFHCLICFSFCALVFLSFYFFAFSNQCTATGWWTFIDVNLLHFSARYGQWHKDKKEPQSKNVPRIIAFVVRLRSNLQTFIFCWFFTFAAAQLVSTTFRLVAVASVSWGPPTKWPTTRRTGRSSWVSKLIIFVILLFPRHHSSFNKVTNDKTRGSPVKFTFCSGWWRFGKSWREYPMDMIHATNFQTSPLA